MIKLGENQELYIVKFADFGAYLNDEEGVRAEHPSAQKQVPEGAQVGDRISVFVYKVQRPSDMRLPILSLRWDIWLSSKVKRNRYRRVSGLGTGKKTCSSRLKSRPPDPAGSFLIWSGSISTKAGVSVLP